MSRLRRRAALMAAVALTTLVAACGDGDGGGGSGSIAEDYDLSDDQLNERGGGDTTRFVVGSKDFEEQEILGQITLQALQAAGAEVVDSTALGSTEQVRGALVAGDIDMYWEYTGTGALIHLAQADPPADAGELFDRVAELDLDRNGIAWLPAAPADNTYALVARTEIYDEGSAGYDADIAAVTRISDLAKLVKQSPDKATVCVGPEFNERADGLPGLEQQYGFRFPDAQVFVLPDPTVYEAVDAGSRCTFGSVFATNGLISELDLRSLEDDDDFFAAYNPALTLQAETLEKYPDLEPMFDDIAGRLDTETLRDLSAQVLVDKRSAEDVAADWLAEQGLVE